MFQWKAKFPPVTHSMIQTSSPWSRRWSPVWRYRLFLSDWFFFDIVRKRKFVEKCRPLWEIEGLDLDCKTVRILAYSSTREQSNKRFGTRLKTERRVTLARFVRVRLLRHALPISLLILRKKPTVLQSSLDWVPSLALIFVRAKHRGNINRFKYFPEAVIFHRNKDGIEINVAF